MTRVYSALLAPLTGAIPLPSNLLRLPLFEGLDAAAFARITAGASEVILRSGTVICRRGETCKGLFIVVEGQVKLALNSPNGTEKVVELVGPGGCIGEMTIAHGRPDALTAETTTETRLICLAKAAVQEELKRTPVFARSVIASLSDRMYCLITAFEDCMLRTGTERVIAYLVNQLPADAMDGHGLITLAVKKGLIASQLNLTQEHFSRILRELISNGLIEVSGRRVRVPDIAQLRARASDAVPATDGHAKHRRSSGVELGSADCGVDGHGDPAVARFDGSR